MIAIRASYGAVNLLLKEVIERGIPYLSSAIANLPRRTMMNQVNTDVTFRVRSLAQDEGNWLGDEIRATNCDYNGCEINANVIFDEDKIPIEYTCDHFFESDLSTGFISETQVSVDYEALIPLEADPDVNERQLQWRVLLAAVKELGLDKCDFGKQRTADSIRRLASLGINTTLYAVRSDLNSSTMFDIRKLSSSPSPLLQYKSQDSPLSRATACTQLTANRTNQCIPVRTVLTLKYQGNKTDDKFVQENVKALLEHSMVNRTEELYVKDVQGLYYVGTFDSVAAERNPGASEQGASRSGGDSIIRIGTLISAASAVLLLLTILMFRRRRDVENQEHLEQVDEKAEADIQDLESAQIAPTMPTNSSAESYLAISSEGSEEAPSLETKPSGEGSAYSEEERLDEADIIASSSSDSAERASLDSHLLLPPRPPRRGDSVQLKTTRRRRKKKKKRPTLKRVNSREHVASMEAIPETISDVSEFESGSEYSTDDDGSSYQSSSTSSTPVRTRSLPGSRSGSPSPNRFPPESISSDVNFIIEALGFPFDRNGNPLRSSVSSLPDAEKQSTAQDRK